MAGSSLGDSWTSAGISWLLGVSYALLSPSVLLLWTALLSVKELLSLICVLLWMFVYYVCNEPTLCIVLCTLCSLKGYLMNFLNAQPELW